jgi:hypothetical protein
MHHTGSHGNTVDGAECGTWEAAALTHWERALVARLRSTASTFRILYLDWDCDLDLDVGLDFDVVLGVDLYSDFVLGVDLHLDLDVDLHLYL